MHRITQTLGNDAPLQGEVFILVKGDALIGRPAHGAVVNDDVLAETAPQGIPFLLGGIAHPEPEIADNDVVGIDENRIVAQGDAVAGSRLAGDGDIPFGDLKCRFELYGSGDLKKDDPCA